jgi:hypothetical protein
MNSTQITRSAAGTVTRYRVMVEGVVSNDGDVRTYCFAGSDPMGMSKRGAEHALTLTNGPAVKRSWIESFGVPVDQNGNYAG